MNNHKIPAIAGALLVMAPVAYAQGTAQDTELSKNQRMDQSRNKTADRSTALDTAARLDEVVVTARKVSENIMTVPLAITALSAADLESADVTDTREVAQLSPGLYFRGQGSTGSGGNDRLSNNLIFRGLNVANNTGVTAGGLTFIDGAPVTSGVVGDLMSVERVEVLVGPQSAYFGRSTFAGAVNYITKDPGNTFGGKLQLQYGSYDSSDGYLSLEGPLVRDKLSVRVAARQQIQGGQYTNAANPSESLGRQETDSVDTTIVAKPADDLKIKVFASYFEDRDGSSATAQLLPSEAPDNLGLGAVGQGTQSNLYPLVPAVGHNYWNGVVPQISPSYIGVDDVLTPSVYNLLINNANHLLVDFDPNFNSKVGLLRKDLQFDATVTYSAPSGYTVTSVSSYHHDKYQQVYDFAYRPETPYLGTCFAGAGRGPGGTCLFPFNTPWMFARQGLGHDESQELRLASPQEGSFRWMVGADYVGSSEAPSISYGTGPLGVATNNNALPQVKTPSAFGGLYYDVTRRLTLSGEARYQWDTVKEYPLGGGAELSHTFTSFSPRVTLNYKLAPDSIVYVLWARGYRPGGFNAALDGASQGVLAQIAAEVSGLGIDYKQEKLDNWEIGFKSRFFDDRADVKVAAYVGKLENEQVNQTVFANEGGGNEHGYSVTSNIGLTNLSGIELQTNVMPFDGMRLTFNFADNDTNIRRYYCAICANYITGNPNPIGNRLPGAPQFTGSLTGQYMHHFAGDYDWYTRIDYIYTGNEYADETNTASTGVRQDLRARIGVQSDALMLELWGTNLTQDTHYAYLTPYQSLLEGLNFTAMFLGLPLKREFGVRAVYSF